MRRSAFMDNWVPDQINRRLSWVCGGTIKCFVIPRKGFIYRILLKNRGSRVVIRDILVTTAIDKISTILLLNVSLPIV